MSKTLLQKAQEWLNEHPNHVHKFIWNPDTLNKHCACGAWTDNKLNNEVHEPWEQL